jgi:hypothetical protein
MNVPNILPYGHSDPPKAETLRDLSIWHFLLGIAQIIAAACYLLSCLVMDDNPQNLSFGLSPLFLLMSFGSLILGPFMLISARVIAKRKNRHFTIVIAALECLFVPFGTLLGILTLRIMCRPETVEIYEKSAVVGPPADYPSQWELRRDYLKAELAREESKQSEDSKNGSSD